MNQEYIKQLEEANEDLRNLLDRERFINQVEKNRKSRWFELHIRYFNFEDVTKGSLSDDEIPIIPYDENKWSTFNVRSMDAVRDILVSNISTESGFYWQICYITQPDGAQQPSRHSLLSGWYSSFSNCFGVGGNFLKVDFRIIFEDVKFYDKFSDYCKYTVSQIKKMI